MITIIACMAKNRVIGRDGGIPWRFPADLKHFKEKTYGHTVVMGRRTYESVGILKGRKNVVLTRSVDQITLESHGDCGCVYFVNDLHLKGEPDWFGPAVLDLSNDNVFVAGGEQVYRSLMPFADYMMLTLIHRDVEGDTYFPRFDPDDWVVVDAQRGNQHSYLEMERVHPS